MASSSEDKLSTRALGKRRERPFNSDALADPARRRPARSAQHLTLDHTTPLYSHKSCVNALSCSNGTGEWLASGSDDRTVQLWRATGDLTQEKPRAVYVGAKGNVFSIAFSCDNRKIFSAGVDSRVHMHDLETGAVGGSAISPLTTWLDNDDAVHAVKTHPTNCNLFITASDDGMLQQYDARATGGAVGCLSDAAECQDVAYHPTTPENFISVNSRGDVLLHDARKAWRRETAFRSASAVAVRKYDSSLLSPLFAEDGQAPVQRYRAVRPSASSVVFSPTGQYFAVTFPHFLPTLYTPSSNTPLACFSSPETAANIKSGEPFSGYRNTTTTKHGSFYGDDVPGGGKLWFAAGSDDFKAYVWEVPPRQLLEDGRRVPGLGQDEWKMADGRPSIAFTSIDSTDEDDDAWETHDDTELSMDPCIPAQLDTPEAIVTGHRSIVNTALFHPTLPLLFTSGIEKHILAHRSQRFTSSVSAGPSWKFVPRGPSTRTAGVYGSLSDYSGDETSDNPEAEDTRALEYFDNLLAQNNSRGDALWHEYSEGDDHSYRSTLSDYERYENEIPIEAFDTVYSLVHADD